MPGLHSKYIADGSVTPAGMVLTISQGAAHYCNATTTLTIDGTVSGIRKP